MKTAVRVCDKCLKFPCDLQQNLIIYCNCIRGVCSVQSSDVTSVKLAVVSQWSKFFDKICQISYNVLSTWNDNELIGVSYVAPWTRLLVSDVPLRSSAAHSGL